jgi:opacity protein-like surface antigen
LGTSGDVSSWNLAYAAYAGLSFEVTEQLTFDVGYRYLYLGSIETDDLVGGGGPPQYNPFEFDNIHSHDVKVGMRYAFY